MDDNATNLRILAAQLERWAMRPRTTRSPAEALAWIHDGAAFDLAILDFHMPEMDGLGWPTRSSTSTRRPRCRS